MNLSSLRQGIHRTVVLLTASVTAVAGLGVLSAPAQAANRVTPGNFTGYGFDQCETQSQEVMDAWLTSSPYLAVGVYIAGDNRYCGDDRQTNLTPEWVRTQLRRGWKVLPITVGPQASCYQSSTKKVRIDANPANNYGGARVQGRLEAADTVARAKALGIARRSTLWYDIEAYDIGNTHCRESALLFLSAWTRAIHRHGYVSGVYSSASSGIRALDDARVRDPRRYVMPDQVWIAEWAGAAAYRLPPRLTPPSLRSAYIRDDAWARGGRMRQYHGDHTETWGGKTVAIDTNYLDLGRGTRGGRAPRTCGVRVDFPRYYAQVRGKRNLQVSALKCMLRRKGFYRGHVNRRFTPATRQAVVRFQRSHGLRPHGRMVRSTWTAMFAEGKRPVLKVGSGGFGVRRVQRALNAAAHTRLRVDGVFGPETTAAVRTYQRAVGLRPTGVVAEDTWAKLMDGRI